MRTSSTRLCLNCARPWGDRAVVRAMHFYNDCRRAAQLCDAVREDDFETFLRLIIEGRSLQL